MVLLSLKIRLLLLTLLIYLAFIMKLMVFLRLSLLRLLSHVLLLILAMSKLVILFILLRIVMAVVIFQSFGVSFPIPVFMMVNDMDENILLNSLYKFANLGYYKHGWELPQLIKNARFLYRDYLTSEHIQLLTGFYNDFAKGHFSNTIASGSRTEAEGGESIETEGEQLHF